MEGSKLIWKLAQAGHSKSLNTSSRIGADGFPKAFSLSAVIVWLNTGSAAAASKRANILIFLVYMPVKHRRGVGCDNDCEWQSRLARRSARHGIGAFSVSSPAYFVRGSVSGSWSEFV